MGDHFKVSDMVPLGANMEPSPHSKVWVNFLPNISLGNILTIVSFAGLVIAGWNAFDKRLSIVEERQNNSAIANSEVKSDVRDIKSTLQKIDNAISVQQFQLTNIQNTQTPRK